MPTLKVDPVTEKLRGVATFNGKIIGEPIINGGQVPFGVTTQEPKVEAPSPTRSDAFVTTCVFHVTCTQPTSTDPSLTRPWGIGCFGIVDDTTTPKTQVGQTFPDVAEWFPSTPTGNDDMATHVVLDVTAEPL